MHPQNIICLVILYSALAVTGLLGNIWVLLTVSSQLCGCGSPNRGRVVKPAIQSSAYIYLLLLSVVDLVSLLPVPMIVTDIQENRFPYGIIMCKLLFLCEGVNKTLSPLVLTALSIDRYIAVCKPTLLWMRQTKFAILVVLLCFSVSLLFIVPITVDAGIAAMIDNKNIITSEKCTLITLGGSTSFKFDLFHTLCCYILPLLIICSVYLGILGKLYRHTRYSTVGRKTSISLSRVVKCSVMVVAFYFICWTPYWSMRILNLAYGEDSFENNNATISDNSTIVDNSTSILNATTNDKINGTNSTDGEYLSSQKNFFNEIFIMYLMHALPYAQSAFNWLFYAFLNRNLRNSSSRCANTVRSAPLTSTIIENGNTSTTGFTPIWKNLQQVGSQIKSVGIDTGNALLKMSPFRTRSRVQSRSSTYLEATYLDRLVPPTGTMSSSLVEISRRPSLIPRTEPSLMCVCPKAYSFSDLPLTRIVDNKKEPSHTGSDTSSVEWL